jgi:WD40-like Beta Propeller Repeat
MPFAQPRRSLGVMIIVAQLVGCSAFDDTRGPEETPSTNQQVSPELIAFVSDREGSDALFVMRPDGSGVRRLTGDLPPVTHPAWSADGQRIAFNAGSRPSATLT